MENKFNFRGIVFKYMLHNKQNRNDFDVFLGTRKLNALRKLSFLFFFMFAGVLDGFSNITVISNSLTTSTCSTFPTAFFLKDTIKIAEGVNSDFNQNQTNVTLILTAPTNFEFQAGIGSVLGRSGTTLNSDINSTSILVTTSTITITFSTDGNANRLDTIFIVGIQIRGITAASTGNITRSGGTATIVGNNAGAGVNHGTLTSNIVLPTPFLISPVTNVCANQTGVIYTTQGGQSNYLWTIVGGTITSGGGVTNNTVTVTWGSSGNGSVSINYTDANGCTATNPTIQNITINQPPSATISYAGTPFCKSLTSAQSVTLTGTSGGTFTSAPAGLSLNSGNGNITPSSSTVGNYTVTYTIAASGGCAAFSTTASVTVNQAPSAMINYSGSPFCSSLTTAQSVTQNGTSGGTFSSTPAGLTLNSANGAITPSTSTTGTYTVTYAIAASGGCAAFSTNASVTVNQAPSATISYAGTPFCKSLTSAQSVTLTGTSGGTFTSAPAGLSLNSGNGNITPSSSTVGNYTVTYTIAASGGCAAFSTTASVTVNQAPSATINYSGSPFCSSLTTAQSVTQNGTSGGTFSSTPAGLTLNSNNGNVIPSSSTPGTYSVTYFVAASGGCAAFTSTPALVVVTQLPISNISYANNPFCQTNTNSQPVTFNNSTLGGTFSATPVSAPGVLNLNSNGDILPSGSDSGNYIVTYSIAAAGGCPLVSSTANISINAESTPPTSISASNTVICNGQTISLTVVGGSLGTGASFKWYKTGCGSGTSIGTGNQITDAPSLGASTTPVTVTYFVRAEGTAAPCNAITTCASVSITINPVPTINATNDITVCGGTPVSIPLNGNTGSSSIYGWINSNATIGLGASGNGNINFNANNPNAPITATIRDSAIFTNAGLSCFSTTDVFVITVNPTPNVTPTNDLTICGGVPFSLTFSGNVTASGIAYNWTNSNANIGLGANGIDSISFTTPNTFTNPVTATIIDTAIFTGNGKTCIGQIDTFLLIINPTPVISASITPQICSEIPLNNEINTQLSGNSLTYSWTSSAPSFITGNTNQGFSNDSIINDTLLNSSSNSGTVSYTMFVNNTLNGRVCSGTLTEIVTVDPTPPTPIITELPGNSSIENLNLCIGSSNITLGIGSNSGNILWSFNPIVAGDSITNPNDTITNIIIQSGTSTIITVTSADNTLPTKCVSKADNLVINVSSNTITSNIIVPFGSVDLAYLDNSLNKYQWGFDSIAIVSPTIFKVQQSKFIDGQIYQLFVPPSKFIANGKLDTLNYWYWVQVYDINGSDTCRTKVYFNGDYRCSGCKGVQPSNISTDVVALAIPNPSNGIFNIKINGNIYGELNTAIFNTLGEIQDERILVKNNDSQEFYYENLKLSSGIYFMHIRGEFGENTIVKLIIK